MCEAAHSLLQRGPSMRKRKAEHPPPVMDLGRLFDGGSRRKLRTDAKGDVAGHGRQRDTRPAQALYNFERRLVGNSWRTHQPIPSAKRGWCCYRGCPGLCDTNAKRSRGYMTHVRCEECSVREGRDVYLCSSVKNGVLCLCHLRYHMERFS